jgi:hypothetical protein
MDGLVHWLRSQDWTLVVTSLQAELSATCSASIASSERSGCSKEAADRPGLDRASNHRVK